MLSTSLLNSYLGKPIDDICLNGFINHRDNHCAHFVSHVLYLEFGTTCLNLVANSQKVAEGGNVRVHEIFGRCSRVHEFFSCPTLVCGLIFVSEHINFRGTPTRLRNIPKKHIAGTPVGLIYNGAIWHYSNTRNQVVVQNMAQFIEHYRNQKNSLWFGEIPSDARPHPWGVSV